MSDGVYLWFLLQNEITITAHQYVNLIQVAIAQGFHLFPFRTEKLSLVTPMVLRHSGRVGSCRFWLKPPDLKKFRRLFFCIHVWIYIHVWLALFPRACPAGSAMLLLRREATPEVLPCSGQCSCLCHKVSLICVNSIGPLYLKWSITLEIHFYRDTCRCISSYKLLL